MKAALRHTYTTLASHKVFVTSGVPQDSILGSVLFSVTSPGQPTLTPLVAKSNGRLDCCVGTFMLEVHPAMLNSSQKWSRQQQIECLLEESQQADRSIANFKSAFNVIWILEGRSRGLLNFWH